MDFGGSATGRCPLTRTPSSRSENQQFLAADHKETDEAAVETLSNPRTVRTLVDLASTAHADHQGQPLRADVGTELYTYHAGPAPFGTTAADVVCIGSPIWIAGA